MKNAVSACAIAVALASVGITAQSTSEVERHIAAAKVAAGTDHVALFEPVCGDARAFLTPAPARGGGGGRGRQGGAPPPPPARETWYAEPARVFDNLSFVGMTEYSAWAVTTSQGIIVIDPVFDYSVEAAVVEGLKKLGFNPSDIRHVVISHGHLDHAGGARLLQERFGARVWMAAADWDMLERQKPAWLPKRDGIVTDGQTLTLGDVTLTMYHTPGHTDGTISTLIPVRDGTRRHVAALWGGTRFNFGPIRERLAAYGTSAERFRDLARKAGADVILSNHTAFDGTKQKLPALAKRQPGAPHPYVVGMDSVGRFLTVASECAQAAVAALPN